MAIRFRKKFLLLGLAMAAFLLSACVPPQAATPGPSPLTILGELQGQAHGEIVEALIVLSRGKHVQQKLVPLVNNEFEAVLQIPVGQWELTVLLVDLQGKVRYQSAAQDIEARHGQPLFTEIILRPADGLVRIAIDLEDYIFQEQALRARIHFNDKVYEVIREESSEPFGAEINVGPGSYEFKIELFTESFRVGDRLGPSAWQVIQVLPEEELEITWSPQTEMLEIIGWIELLLPEPQNLGIEQKEGGVKLSWDPLPEANVQGFYVFAQTDPLARFEILNPTSPVEHNFFHELALEGLTEIRYTVAAVSGNGLVGFYAEPVSLFVVK